MDQLLNPTLYNECNYLSMPGLFLIQVSEGCLVSMYPKSLFIAMVRNNGANCVHRTILLEHEWFTLFIVSSFDNGQRAIKSMAIWHKDAFLIIGLCDWNPPADSTYKWTVMCRLWCFTNLLSLCQGTAPAVSLAHGWVMWCWP